MSDVEMHDAEGKVEEVENPTIKLWSPIAFINPLVELNSDQYSFLQKLEKSTLEERKANPMLAEEYAMQLIGALQVNYAITQKRAAESPRYKLIVAIHFLLVESLPITAAQKAIYALLVARFNSSQKVLRLPEEIIGEKCPQGCLFRAIKAYDPTANTWILHFKSHGKDQAEALALKNLAHEDAKEKQTETRKEKAAEKRQKELAELELKAGAGKKRKADEIENGEESEEDE